MPVSDELAALLKALEEELVDLVPRLLASRTFPHPIATAFIVYNDTTCIDGDELFVQVLTDDHKHALMASDDGSLGWWNVNQLNWKNGELFYPMQLNVDFKKCYGLVSDMPEEDTAHVDLMPLRHALHTVARRLNSWNWSSVLNVTDDFVFTVTDSSALLYLDSLSECIPEDKLAVLRGNGSIPAGS